MKRFEMKQSYSNKRIVVIGAGLTGLALVRFLVERGATVALSDMRPAEQIANLDQLADLNVRLDLGGHSLELFEQADLIAVSPGVPLECPPLRRAASCNIPLLGEIELAARAIAAPLIVVTGTNGKSTTTSLIGRALEADGRKVFVGGNIGTPLVEACAEELDVAVVELSSFQLETVELFKPQVALLLNLSPDHLDRYADLADYYRAKLNVFQRMTAADFAVLNGDDPVVCELTQGIAAQKVWFSAGGRQVEGLVRRGASLLWNWQGSELELSLAELQLAGEHNIENAMAALVACLLQGCDPQRAWQAICSFTGLDHRMQLVRSLNGVNWYNDSKGTNVGSVVKSLSGFSENLVLIAGGRDKGSSYAPLRPLLAQCGKCLILIGEAAQRMAAELSGACEIRLAASLEMAVAQAFELTQGGGTVLLSPACSSFDMFTSYQERGSNFVRLVNALPEGESK
jgi:UDP-N-acetylmuramoylalanine--D-glutamate ligase